MLYRTTVPVVHMASPILWLDDSNGYHKIFSSVPIKMHLIDSLSANINLKHSTYTVGGLNELHNRIVAVSLARLTVPLNHWGVPILSTLCIPSQNVPFCCKLTLYTRGMPILSLPTSV